jgi:lipid A ethanolaminephosphotransferase
MPPRLFRWTPATTTFIAWAAAVNTLLYHLPLYSFAARDLDLTTTSGLLALATLPVVIFLGTALLLVLLGSISHRILKPICIVLAIGNAIALYFLLSYHVILDVTMMGNVFDTDLAESSEFLTPGLLLCVLLSGVVPVLLLLRVRIMPSPRSRLGVAALSLCVVTLAWAWSTAITWLWIDQNSKRLGGMILPWSYVINAARVEAPKIWNSDTQEPLPAATFASDERTVVVLVIGEAARAADFSLYGYARPTNALLPGTGVIALRNATACATYTTAAVRCILSDVDTGAPFAKAREPLTSYLQRHGVDVAWRTRNFGEPPMHVQSYQKAADLAASCTGTGCKYDEVLLSGLEERIRASQSHRTFVVLHQLGSHGPAYYTRYPGEFERFAPVCKFVEPSKCSPQELLNAYDNTIVYEDHFLAQTIGMLRRLEGTSALLIYISDHGESLGEYGLYLHGVPFSIAPDVQKKIPFLVWMSDEFARNRGVHPERLEAQAAHSQRDVFHTVMGAFSMRGDAYQARYDIFNDEYGTP